MPQAASNSVALANSKLEHEQIAPCDPCPSAHVHPEDSLGTGAAYITSIAKAQLQFMVKAVRGVGEQLHTFAVSATQIGPCLHQVAMYTAADRARFIANHSIS